MLLYDVFYKGHTFDPDIPLPKPGPDIRYAHCTNGQPVFKVPALIDGHWVWETRREKPEDAYESLKHEANAVVNTIMRAEVNGSLASDCRRALREERMKLQHAIKSGDAESISNHMAETRRVATMWEAL